MSSKKTKNALKKQAEYIHLFEQDHDTKDTRATEKDKNDEEYEKLMKDAEAMHFDFWEVEYTCPDPGPYPPWAWGKDQDRLNSQALWSDMLDKQKASSELHNNTWYAPEITEEIQWWLQWVSDFNKQDEDEKKQDQEWKWDYTHKMYLPTNSSWFRINRYLLRKPDYEGLTHWKKSRVNPQLYYSSKKVLENDVKNVRLPFQYYYKGGFHELVCDYETIKQRLPLLTNDYAHKAKLENGTQYHISLCFDWMLEQDDQLPLKPANEEDIIWVWEDGQWKKPPFKKFLRDRLLPIKRKWRSMRELEIPTIRVSRGGTYEFYNPYDGPATSDDLAELTAFIKDAYETSKPGVSPHISFD